MRFFSGAKSKELDIQQETKQSVSKVENSTTITEKRQAIEENSELYPQFRDRDDFKQLRLKKEVEKDNNFSFIEGQKPKDEIKEYLTDKSFIKNVKSFDEISQMTPDQRRIFYEEVLKVKFPYTKFSKRLNASYKENLFVPLLTWQLYNWQYFTMRDSPTWVTHDGPSFTSGRPHIGLFYNKVSRLHIKFIRFSKTLSIDLNCIQDIE